VLPGHGWVTLRNAHKPSLDETNPKTFLAGHESRTSKCKMATSQGVFHVKSLPLVLCIGVLSLCLTFAQNPSTGQKAIPAKSDVQISFDTLKSLAGTWTGPVTTDPPNPDIDGTIQVTMRVASGGNLLVHEISPGGVPEPTMIYLEGDRLTLVHYCEAGNRPRLVARKSPGQKTVEFDFVDISGSPKPAYLHHFVFTIINADHHTEDWTFMLPDGKLMHAHFDLKQANESVRQPAGK
jgi:hypothetical protein